MKVAFIVLILKKDDKKAETELEELLSRLNRLKHWKLEKSTVIEG